MNAPEALILDLLSSLKGGPRPYREIMEAWRTSCPRLPVWEDAVDQHLICRDGSMIALTEAGRACLASVR